MIKKLNDEINRLKSIEHIVAEREDLIIEVEQLRNQLSEAVECIKELMWVGDSHGRPYCNECHGYKEVGHMPRCSINRLLSHIQGKENPHE
ncbi:hypothetical protein [Ferviditalea candida]|uniref:Uncharacterized protein n=1 Tax=Ferviditalea candida TaxID=3108399 RepID=A0ABU5ZKL4_9BACL|nr:hypothetical protein [Paenibacillaceae bacterium T2]